MQDQPILVFAQSARFIAQSATLAGYTVWVADCYGDVDTRHVASRFQLLPPFHQLSSQQLLQTLQQLSCDQPCYLLCGTGVEQYYSILSQLPDNITLLGTAAESVRELKQFPDFFALLDQLNLHYPPTQQTRPDTPENWLIKSSQGYGGVHIENAADTEKETADTDLYFQQYLSGISGSACFIGNGYDSKILSINQQQHVPDSFKLEAIISPLALSPQLHSNIANAVEKLTVALQIKGIASLDFIIHDDALFILELNPRISASAELIADPMLFHWHLSACMGQALHMRLAEDGQQRLLKYIFADTALTIPAGIDWPDTCHDIPAPATQIYAQQPICTLTLFATNKQALLAKSDKIELKLKQKLTFLS